MWLIFRARLPGGMLSELSQTVHALKLRGTIAREFHFEACWAEKEGCRHLIEKCWGSTAIRDGLQGTVSSIQLCTRALSSWNRSNRRKINLDIREKRKELRFATSEIKDGS
ncbi:hypothetical protein LWI29_027401 [Acer saccharum]|uniref:Uncharacterized protein n=1 Tax=Acer saccharum TaxID=4024 RepID=A0AA39S9R3_ACESA|nr:hypothetical protein LWI29_027401 [Acer saccharum]